MGGVGRGSYWEGYEAKASVGSRSGRVQSKAKPKGGGGTESGGGL